MNLSQIRVLLAVAECGSVTRAAERLNVTQPAVTKRVRELEASLGVVLLERSGRGVIPTRAGRTLIRHAVAAVAELNRAEGALAELRDEVDETIQIGSLPNVAHSLVPNAVMRLLAERPRVSVAITEDTLDVLMVALQNGHLDVIVGALPSESAGRDLIQETLFLDRLYVVGRKGHPFADRTDLTLAELVNADWIVPHAGVHAHSQWRNAFLHQGLEPPQHRIETTSLTIMRTMLLSSDRIAVLGRQVFELEERLGLMTVLPIDLPTTTRPIGVTTRTGAAHSEPLQLLIEHVRQAAADHVGSVVSQRLPRAGVIPVSPRLVQL